VVLSGSHKTGALPHRQDKAKHDADIIDQVRGCAVVFAAIGMELGTFVTETVFAMPTPEISAHPDLIAMMVVVDEFGHAILH